MATVVTIISLVSVPTLILLIGMMFSKHWIQFTTALAGDAQLESTLFTPPAETNVLRLHARPATPAKDYRMFTFVAVSPAPLAA